MTSENIVLTFSTRTSVFQVDSGPRTVADFGGEAVEEVPQEEDQGAVAEGALEQGGRSWLSHTDMKVCITLF